MKIANLIFGMVALATSTLFSTTYQKANATSCWRLTPLEHIEQQDIIFFGTVVRTPVVLNELEKLAEFKVLRAYKGVQEAKVKIKLRTYNGGISDDWGYRRGQSILVFADSATNEANSEITGIVHNCSAGPYDSNPEVHWKYWDILAKMTP